MDRWDVLGIVGTLMIAAGWWFIWPPAILFWLGFVALMAGVMGARNGHTH